MSEYQKKILIIFKHMLNVVTRKSLMQLNYLLVELILWFIIDLQNILNAEKFNLSIVVHAYLVGVLIVEIPLC
jgi:hypothetical protein